MYNMVTMVNNIVYLKVDKVQALSSHHKKKIVTMGGDGY